MSAIDDDRAAAVGWDTAPAPEGEPVPLGPDGRPEAATPPLAPGSTPLKAAIWYAVTHAIRHAEQPSSSKLEALVNDALKIADAERAALAAERDELRAAVAALAADLETSAAATSPSRKSEIEYRLALRLTAILEATGGR